jgi:hypothetical protein
MRTDAPKNDRTKIYENRCSEKRGKKTISVQMLRKTQRKRYKQSVTRQVLQIKTTARHCAQFQYENKGLNKNKQQQEKTAKSMTISSTGSFVCTSDTTHVG